MITDSPLNTLWEKRAQHIAAMRSQLVVLAGTPSWGAPHILRALGRHFPDATLVRDAATLERILTQDQPSFLLIDSALQFTDAPQWQQLLDYLEANPQARAVAASADPPPMIATAAGCCTLLDESTLALTAPEVIPAVRAIIPDVPEIHVHRLLHNTRGCAALIARQLELWQSDNQFMWAQPAVPLSFGLVMEALTLLQDNAYAGSPFLLSLASATGLRRFTARMLVGPSQLPDPAAAHRIFTRLQAWPLGANLTDGETGEPAIEWDNSLWHRLEEVDLSHERLKHALDVTVANGHTTVLRLYYLLRLRYLDQAEDLANINLRQLLLTADHLTTEAFDQLDLTELQGYPSLLTVRGDLLFRVEGDTSASRTCYENAYAQYARAHATGDLSRLRLAARLAFTAVSQGSRKRAERALSAFMNLMFTAGEGDFLERARLNPDMRSALSAETYLAYWTAVQLDRHAYAVQLGQVMISFANPRSPSAEHDTLAPLTLLRLAGFHPGVPAPAFTDHFQLLAGSLDYDAVNLARTGTRSRNVPTNSIADALLLLVCALTGHGPAPSEVDSLVERSRRFWDDHRPSTFVTLAGVVAYTAQGCFDAARQLLDTAGKSDGYVAVARGIYEFARGNSQAAITAFRAQTHSELPAVAHVAATLTATAEARLGNGVSAVRELETLVTPELADISRVALRLVTDQDLAELTELAASAAPGSYLLRVLTEETGTFRPYRAALRESLTPAEAELIPLLRQGLTNEEMARARFVSANTIKTQMRSILKKTGTGSREEALQALERTGNLH